MKTWGALLNALGAAVAAPDIKRLLDAPALGRDQLAEIVGDALIQYGQSGTELPAEAQLRAFLRLLTQNGRLKLAPVIAH
ncbi:MAG: hypothetical protein L0H29_04170 [Sinobacteraceae bacterium]|nr:hypothetical protein [Nevskiaceae bacterium]